MAGTDHDIEDLTHKHLSSSFDSPLLSLSHSLEQEKRKKENVDEDLVLKSRTERAIGWSSNGKRPIRWLVRLQLRLQGRNNMGWKTPKESPPYRVCPFSLSLSPPTFQVRNTKNCWAYLFLSRFFLLSLFFKAPYMNIFTLNITNPMRVVENYANVEYPLHMFSSLTALRERERWIGIDPVRLWIKWQKEKKKKKVCRFPGHASGPQGRARTSWRQWQPAARLQQIGEEFAFQRRSLGCGGGVDEKKFPTGFSNG